MGAFGNKARAFLPLAACCAALVLLSVVGSSSPTLPPCDSGDLQALREFAGALTNGWPVLSSTWSKESPSCCTWEGVSCTEGINGGVASAEASRVKSLRLPGRGLEGSISSSLGRLDQLEALDLSRNLLRGALPAELSGLVRLHLLNLSFNALSGTVGPAIAGLTSLGIIDLSSNYFNGTDLFELGGFTSLAVFNVSNNSLSGPVGRRLCLGSGSIQLLDLSINRFSGQISDEGISGCGALLRGLYLDDNSFSGGLPGSLFNLEALESLSLSSNNFSGSLPVRLRNLSKLSVLVLSENRFSGPLPDVFDSLTLLRRFVAHSNLFSGGLPTSLSRCSSLEELNLRNNSLGSGGAAAAAVTALDFSQLTRLSSLDLATNGFSGPLPVGIAGCRWLKTLSLAKNSFTGAVPDAYGDLLSLSFLSLSNNSLRDLEGALKVLRRCGNLTTLILTRNFRGEELPADVVGFQSLKILALGNCALSGRIPAWLANCRKLEVLDLSWNRLQGNIPPWLGELESLFYLDISNNSLSGPIPVSLTGLKSLISPTASPPGTVIGMPLFVKRNQTANGLQYNQISSFPPALYLNDNGITGPIWPEFGRLKQLHVLDLSNNSITGTIPGSIAGMENLEILDLSSNQLRGPIPRSLNRLSFLSKFSVAHNNLSGQIPDGGQFFSFSISSFEGNPGLCGDPAPPCNRSGAVGSASPPLASPSKMGRRAMLGITISIGVGVACLLATVVLRLSRREQGCPAGDAGREEGTNKAPGPAGPSKLVLFFHGSGGKELTIPDLLRSTNNFDQANIIGCGGFGLVYKASLPDGTQAAIKRLSSDCGQMEREFQAEVESLSRAQHRNLVSLKGYCKFGHDRLLIYSYMENGSLDYWLHERVDGGALLRWDARLRIAQGAARGLAYLHTACDPNIIHRDVKSSNILLDGSFEAHLADFGLSRLICPYDTHVTTDLVGTLGYIPPEYGQTLTATLKGDVYSFGIVLLELLTGRRPVDVCRAKGSRDLVSWVLQMKAEGKEEQVFDPLVWSKPSERQLRAVLETACKCISGDPRSRPSIEEVLSWLDGV